MNPNHLFQGMFRGKVVANDGKLGRCKVFVHGVYPDEFEKTPNLLPDAEPAQPLFGDSCQWPDVGTGVWVFFERGNHNFPIFIAQINGKSWNAGDNKKHVIKTDKVTVTLDDGAEPTLKVVCNGKVNVDITGDTTLNIVGNVTQTVTGNISNTQIGNKTENTTGNTTNTQIGNKTDNVTGNDTENILGFKTWNVGGLNFTSSPIGVFSGDSSVTVPNLIIKGNVTITGKTTINGMTTVNGNLTTNGNSQAATRTGGREPGDIF